ncbi:MAG: DUF1580 domain-containing protein [Planctomycetia bacterium]|nr:DUF1580 domain-containing protein [Planctomycetia bacterium]
MIDPLVEELLSLAAAAKAKFLPGRRQSKRPSLSCIYRWTKAGCRGVILESVQCGGTRCTSREALARFMAALTALESPVPSSPALPRAVPAAVDRTLDRLLG